jgi:hypothetical protein
VPVLVVLIVLVPVLVPVLVVLIVLVPVLVPVLVVLIVLVPALVVLIGLVPVRFRNFLHLYTTPHEGNLSYDLIRLP